MNAMEFPFFVEILFSRRAHSFHAPQCGQRPLWGMDSWQTPQKRCDGPWSM